MRQQWYPIDHLGSASQVLFLGLSQMPLLQEIRRINRIAQKENLLGSTREVCSSFRSRLADGGGHLLESENDV